MLIHELLPLLGDATTVVEVGAGDGSVRALLRTPDTLTYRRYGADAGKLDRDTVVVAFTGPKPETQVDAEAIAPALRELPIGGRAVLLLGWPIAELPYHRLLDVLVDAGCQVLQVVPLDKVSRHGAHCAVLAARVDRLAPLRSHLDDTPIELNGHEPALRGLLRLTGEYLFGDLLGRPARRRLAEQQDRLAAQDKRIRELEKELTARDQRIAATEEQLAHARRDLAGLRASTPFQVGTAVVQGARRPARAIVSVPVGLVRIWRRRRPGSGRPGGAG